MRSPPRSSPDVSPPVTPRPPDGDQAQVDGRRSLAARLTTPRAVFVALVLTLLAVLLLTPEPQEEFRGVLDSRSTRPGGARALYELTERLGWPVSRRTRPFAAPLDSTAVYLVLEPSERVTPIEVNALLNAVRAGAALVVTHPGLELQDSLWRAIGVRAMPSGGPLTTGAETPEDRCPAPLRQHGTLIWAGDRITSSGLMVGDTLRMTQVFGTVERPAAVLALERRATEAELRGDSSEAQRLRREAIRTGNVRGPRAAQPAVAGFTLGRGRVVYVADPDVLRNDVLRYCPWGADVMAVRVLEWASGGGRPRVVFDEAHHPGFGAPWYVRLANGLTSNADGRVALSLIIASLVLILALGRRPLPPVSTRRLERRSPLEHVDALARAYTQARATRTAARRLVRGLRRRHATLVRREDDAAFLSRVAERHPALRDEVALLRRATIERVAPDDLDRVLAAVDSVDRTLSRT